MLVEGEANLDASRSNPSLYVLAPATPRSPASNARACFGGAHHSAPRDVTSFPRRVKPEEAKQDGSPAASR